MEDTLKQSVLANYYLIEEIFTLKTFNKTIMNLVNKGIYFSSAEFQKHKVVETVSNFISKSQLDLFLIKMKLTMLALKKWLSPKYQISSILSTAYMHIIIYWMSIYDQFLRLRYVRFIVLFSLLLFNY